MGRIRSGSVKRAAEQIYQDHKSKFKADFEHNKKAVGGVADIATKKLRNMVAGYITKKVKTTKEIEL